VAPLAGDRIDAGGNALGVGGGTRTQGDHGGKHRLKRGPQHTIRPTPPRSPAASSAEQVGRRPGVAGELRATAAARGLDNRPAGQPALVPLLPLGSPPPPAPTPGHPKPCPWIQYGFGPQSACETGWPSSQRGGRLGGGPVQGGGHHLAVLAQQRPVRAEEEGRAVERAALALHHPDHQAEVVPAGRSSDGLGGRAGHLDGAVAVAAELLPALTGDRDGGLSELVRFVTPGGERPLPP
jgi:hypothetical protein